MVIFSMASKKALKQFFLFLVLFVASIGSKYVLGQDDSISSLPEIVLGHPNARVTVIEYSCVACGHCAQFQQQVYPLIKSNYIDTNKIIYIHRQFSLDGLSLKAAQLLYCKAIPQPQREKLLKKLYTHHDLITSEKNLLQLAKQFGISEKIAKGCIKNEALQRQVLLMRLEGQQKLGVNGTPTFFINGKKIVGCAPYEEFKRIIDEELRNTSS